jgi:hypothetical protein
MAAIDTFFPTVFQTSFDQVLQQENSKLLSAVTRDDFTGNNKWYNIMEDDEMSAITVRKGVTPDGEMDAYKVWNFQAPFHKVTTFDEWDQHFLGSIVLPTSDTVRNHVMAYNRKVDDVIIDALGGNRVTGESAGTSTALPSGQKVAVDFVESGSTTNSGLTIGKLRQAQYIMDTDEVPEEDRFFVCTAKQKQDLLRTTELTSSDYSEVKALVRGQIDTFLGFKFIMSQRLDTITTNVRAAYAFHKRAIKLSGKDRMTKMDELPTRNHALQIRTKCMLGAFRYMDELVVQVACHESL